MSLVIDQTADISVKQAEKSVYRYRKLNQVNGGSTLNLSTSTTLAQFNIPNSVYNFSRSYLQFDLSEVKQTTYSSFYVDSAPLNSIRLQSSRGEILVDIQNSQVYSRVSSLFKSVKDAKYGVSSAAAIANATNQANLGNIAYNSTRTTANLSVNLASDAQIVDDNAGTGSTISALTNAQGFIKIQHLVTSALDTAQAFRYKIDLSSICSGSIMGVDKDLFLNDNLLLTLYFQPYNQWGFKSAVDGATPLILTAAPVVTNFNLYLAEQMNVNLIENYRAAVSQGVKMVVPYVQSNQLSTPAAVGYVSMSSNLSAGMGLKLKRIITIPINSTNSLNKTSDVYNIGSVKWSQIQTSFNSRPIQDQFLTVDDSTLYNYHSSKLNDTLINSEDTYLENCFFLDDFSNSDSVSDYKHNDMELSGLDMGMNNNVYTVQIYQNATASLILCQFQVFNRMLMVTNQGLSWVSE
jgi:hypothetical protein